MGGQYPFYNGIVRESVRRRLFLTGCRPYLALLGVRDANKQIPVPDVQKDLEDIFGFSPRHIQRILKNGNGSFWEYHPGSGRYDRGMVKLKTPIEVAVFLRCALDDPEWRDVSELVENSTAYAYVNVLRNHSETSSPLTRNIIAEMTGICPRSQAYHVKALGLEETPNFLIEEMGSHEQMRKVFSERNYAVGPFRIIERGIYSGERLVHRGAVILRQIGNSRGFDTYSENGEIVKIGETRGAGIWAPRLLGQFLQTRYVYSITSNFRDVQAPRPVSRPDSVLAYRKRERLRTHGHGGSEAEALAMENAGGMDSHEPYQSFGIVHVQSQPVVDNGQSVNMIGWDW